MASTAQAGNRSPEFGDLRIVEACPVQSKVVAPVSRWMSDSLSSPFTPAESERDRWGLLAPCERSRLSIAAVVVRIVAMVGA